MKLVLALNLAGAACLVIVSGFISSLSAQLAAPLLLLLALAALAFWMAGFNSGFDLASDEAFDCDYVDDRASWRDTSACDEHLSPFGVKPEQPWPRRSSGA